MPNVSDVVFFILMNIDMHLFFAICTMMVLNFGFVELEDSDILGSEYLHIFIIWYRRGILKIACLNFQWLYVNRDE